jgi:hypothetical protein
MDATQGSSAFSVPKRAALLTSMSLSPMIAFSGVRNSWHAGEETGLGATHRLSLIAAAVRYARSACDR